MPNTKKNILVTGGTGFFGRSLLRKWKNQAELGEKNENVCVLTRDMPKFISIYPEFKGLNWLKFHQGDILVPSTLPNNESFTHILHAATESTNGPELEPLDRYIQIVDGTRNMLDYAVKNNTSRFLLTSSGGVYGQQPKEMNDISEDYYGIPNPLNSNNAYSLGKLAAESLCSLYREKFKLQCVIARCFTFVGRDLPLEAHFAIGNFIKEALSKNNITIKGDGTAIRTYLDQRDLADWLNILLLNGKDGNAYNVGSDEQISIKELAEVVKKVICPNAVIKIKNENNKKDERNRYIPNIDKIKKEFNVKIKYELKESIIDTAKWNSTNDIKIYN